MCDEAHKNNCESEIINKTNDWRWFRTILSEKLSSMNNLWKSLFTKQNTIVEI